MKTRIIIMPCVRDNKNRITHIICKDRLPISFYVDNTDTNVLNNIEKQLRQHVDNVDMSKLSYMGVIDLNCEYRNQITDVIYRYDTNSKFKGHESVALSELLNENNMYFHVFVSRFFQLYYRTIY